jgi:hypothetical protein
LGRLTQAQIAECEDRPVPGAEVFRRELVVAADVAQVGVDVAGVDRVALSVFVDVLEELLSRQLLQLPDDARQAQIGEPHHVLFPALAGELEPDGALALEARVPIAQRGESE